jgi:hypothetical protein
MAFGVRSVFDTVCGSSNAHNVANSNISDDAMWLEGKKISRHDLFLQLALAEVSGAKGYRQRYQVILTSWFLVEKLSNSVNISTFIFDPYVPNNSQKNSSIIGMHVASLSL